ncbi:MAG: OmpA family protein [Granulosicoccaceae bacterium]
MKIKLIRSNNVKAWLPLMVIATSLLAGGCNTVKVLSPTNLSIPDNDPSFRSRLYGGASIGSSSLDPNLSSAPAFHLASDSDQTSQLRLGYDVHNMLSVEVENTVLGTAELAEAGTSVKYSAFGVSALIYGINGVQNRSRREGWSAYGRLGYSYVQRASAVIPLDNSNSSAVFGLGAEYGMKNGLGIRGEITRFDEDASNFSIGAIYRFGLSAREIGNVFATAANPALSSSTTRVPSGGRVRGNTVQGAKTSAPQKQNQGDYYPTTALAVQAWSPRVTRSDEDGDGINNRIDRCPDTSARSTVGGDGCGLFDATLSDVVFKSGSHWLTPKARGQLDKLSETLLAFPEARIQVRAHTDNKGPADINMNLSERRAEAVVEYLQSKGIAELQLEALGMGESQPMDSNDTADGRKRNRRVEIATLSNISPDMWDSINERAEKVKVVAAAVSTRAPAKSRIPSEPIFPALAAIQLPAIPKPGYVAGFTMTGVVAGVSFVSDSAALTEPSSQSLKKLSHQLKAVPDVKIAIMAHTDNQGDESANQTLSVSRALAVVDFLVAQGISKPRLLPEGYGESLPLVQNVTDSDRARNRRIEVRVLN